MAATRSRKLFVNLAVRNVKTSIDFFTKLGFSFNPKFTDDNAACMIVSEEAFVMLLAESYFKTFTRRALCDGSRQTEGLFAVSCENKSEVDDLVRKALAAGATHAMDAHDHGFMYGHGFQDLDDHIWELIHMDTGATP